MRRGKRVFTVALRLWTLATRFVLVFFLARYLEAEDVGLYGLLVATVTYVVYVLGMDFYTYSTREILKADRAEWRSRVFSHSAFVGCVYVIVLPLLLVLFALGVLPWTTVIWFYLITVTEHVSMEIDRMLIAMSDQLGASVVVFTRQALLPTVVIPVLMLLPEARNLELVLAGWVGFNVIAIALGGVMLARKVRTGAPARVEWRWVLRGIKVSLAFFAGTLCLRLLFAADRQIVALLDGLDTLGAYTLAMSVGTGLSSVVAVAVHQFSYPRLVVAVYEKDRDSFRKEMRAMTTQTIGLVVLAASAVLLLRDVLLRWVGGEIYADYAWLFFASIAVYGVYNISLLPHYALYALHADRVILISTIFSLVAFASAAAALIAFTGDAVIGVLAGLTAASVLLLTWKGIASVRFSRVTFA